MPSLARPLTNDAPERGQQIIRFDRYQVHVASGELLKEGRKIRLQPQPFQLLVLLLRNAGRVVTREEIQRELWTGDTFVDFDHGLAAAVNKVRDALCDSADDPKLVETLHKRGYRFIGKVEPEPPVEIRARLGEVPQDAQLARATERSPSLKQGTRWLWMVLAVVLLMVAGAAGSVWRRKNARPTIPVAQEWSLSQFTSYVGNSTAPAFSPDGSRIAFGWDGGKDGPNYELYVKALGGETRLQLTHHPSEWISARWSPDGTEIGYMRVAGADTGIYVVPALGGVERKLLATTTPYDVVAPISWSPDGKWIAYTQLAPGKRETRNYLYSLESQRSRAFYHDAACEHEGNLTFSTDGKRVAWYCVRNLEEIDVMVGDPEGIMRRRVTTLQLLPIGLAWTSDDSKIVLALSSPAHTQVYEVDMRDGILRKAAGPASDLLASWAAVSPKSGGLAWSSSRYHLDLARIDLKKAGVGKSAKAGSPAAAGEPAQSILYSSRNQDQASYSPDGKHVVFDSDRSGTWNVWVGDADGSNLVQLSHGGIAGYPRWSPDSRKIVYQQTDLDISNLYSIYIADLAERTPRKLNTGTLSVGAPFWSTDGQSIYFIDEGAFVRKYYRCALQCDKNEVLIRDGEKALNMAASEDGKSVYYVQGGGDAKLFRGVMRDGRVEDEVEVKGVPIVNGDRAFFAENNGVYFVSAEQPKVLQYYDSQTAKSKMVFTAEKPISSGFWISSDRRWAIVSQLSDTHQDIMLAEPKH